MAGKAFNEVGEDRWQLSNELLVKEEHVEEHIMANQRFLWFGQLLHHKGEAHFEVSQSLDLRVFLVLEFKLLEVSLQLTGLECIVLALSCLLTIP